MVPGMRRCGVGVLVSHAGSNLRALAAAAERPGAPFSVDLVISNNSGSAALAFARDRGIPAVHLSSLTHPDPAALDRAMLTELRRSGASLVVAAGYLKRIGPETLRHYADRVINVHPSLLPSHGGQGMHGRAVHEAVLASGAAITGASVHLVTREYDAGPVIARREVAICSGDTADTLAERVLIVEHELLCEVVQDLARPGGDVG